jgi:hypothetical protein
MHSLKIEEYIYIYIHTHMPAEQFSAYLLSVTYSVICFRWAAHSVAVNAQNQTSINFVFLKPLESNSESDGEI